jgi:DNA mismatch repair ATPase MutS
MKLFHSYTEIENRHTHIPQGIVIIQVGNFYEILNENKAISLNRSIDLKLRKCHYCPNEIVGFNIIGSESWFEKIVNLGFIIILVQEIEQNLEERRKKTAKMRHVTQIISISTFYQTPLIIMDTLTFSLRKIDILHKKKLSVKPKKQFNNLNHMLGELAKILLSQDTGMEIFIENEADTTHILKRLKEIHEIVFIRHITTPVLSSICKIFDIKENNLTSTAYIADDEPVSNTDMLVDSTTLHHLRIHQIKKFLSLKCKTKDAKFILAFMIANPSTNLEYFQTMSRFRGNLNKLTSIPWSRQCSIFSFLKEINKQNEASEKNIMNTIKQTEIIRQWIETIEYNEDLQTLVQVCSNQYKDNFNVPDIINENNCVELIVSLKNILRKKKNFNPVVLMQHWKQHVLKNLNSCTQELNKNDVFSTDAKTRFLIKTKSGYERHERTDEFEDMYETELMTHNRLIQESFDKILAQVSSYHINQFKTIAYIVGIIDILTHVKLLSYADIHIPTSTYSQLEFKGLCRPNFMKTDITNEMNFSLKNNIIRGSNGSGKTTFARAIALNIYLSHCGLPVSASQMSMQIFDTICLRFGAADNFKKNLSSFENECTHMREILQSITSSSFVAIDEFGMVCESNIGRQLCLHVLRKLHKIGCLNIFLTHYNNLQADLPFAVRNLTMGRIPYSFKIQENTDVTASSDALIILKKIGLPIDIIIQNQL